MGARSSILSLDQGIREEVDRLIREDRCTIKQILEHPQSLGGSASFSAVARYVRKGRQQMARYREAQEIAKIWIGKLEEDPSGDVGRLVAEMLRVVTFQHIGAIDDNSDVGPADVSMLASAIKDLAAADKISTDRELKIRERVLKKAADAASRQARKEGISEATVRKIKASILGLNPVTD